MTLYELQQEYNRFHAFDEFLTVREAKDMGIIPKVYWENEEDPDKGAFPDHCLCGSENIITTSLTQAQCCDPHCRIKMGYSLSELFTRFAIKGVGDAYCSNLINAIYDDLKCNSYLEALTLRPDQIPFSLRGREDTYRFIRACYSIRQNTLTFPQMVSKLGLPELSDSTEKLLSGISSFSQLKSEILKYGDTLNYCASRGVLDNYKVFWFYISFKDIIIAESIFRSNIRAEGLREIDICITGSMSPRGNKCTKAEFVAMCNEAAKTKDGVQLFEIKMTTAIESVDYVIADYESTSRKYTRGKERGVICSSSDFLKIIEDKVAVFNDINVDAMKNKEASSCKEMKVF